MNTLLGELGESSGWPAAPCTRTRANVDIVVRRFPLAIATLNDVQFPRYRVAFKFRKLQKNLFCEFLRTKDYVCTAKRRARY